MLVVRRKLNESVKVGEATITILAVENTTIDLGIEAPEDVPIIRDDAKSAEQQHRREK